MPQYAMLSTAEANAIHILREMANDQTRKQVKRELFARAKTVFGIPPDHRLVVETDVSLPNACILKNKATRESYELNAEGKWIHAATNGANQAKRWFRLPTDLLFQAVVDTLDNEEAQGNAIFSQDTQPPASMILNAAGDEAVVIDGTGSLWVQLDIDAYEHQRHLEEEDDDLPF